MSKLLWDQNGERLYETGVEQAALYPVTAGAYGVGEAWNGLISVTETPSGAEPTALYANDKKYGELTSAEELGGSIEAYTYPDGFAACNGEATIVAGMKVAQQTRVPFGLVYKTLIGNDTEGIKHGYKLNIIYNAKVSPSEQANSTVNDSPEAKTMSWEFTTTPVEIPGYESSSKLCFDSTAVDAEKLAALEAILYGSDDVEPRLPMPAEIIEMMKEGIAG